MRVQTFVVPPLLRLESGQPAELPPSQLTAQRSQTPRMCSTQSTPRAGLTPATTPAASIAPQAAAPPATAPAAHGTAAALLCHSPAPALVRVPADLRTP